jgi:hypothetical protein
MTKKQKGGASGGVGQGDGSSVPSSSVSSISRGSKMGQNSRPLVPPMLS